MRLLQTLRQTLPSSAPLLGGFVLFFAGGAIYTALHGSQSWPLQPIAFNHSRHVQVGVGCTDCHSGARNGAKATLPTIDTCTMCHQSALTKSPEEQKLLALAAANQPLAWVQLTRIPAHVYFSHRRHTESAGIECTTCHGAMDKLTSPP